jgi:hypothetical protein
MENSKEQRTAYQPVRLFLRWEESEYPKRNAQEGGPITGSATRARIEIIVPIV